MSEGSRGRPEQILAMSATDSRNSLALKGVGACRIPGTAWAVRDGTGQGAACGRDMARSGNFLRYGAAGCDISRKK